MASPWQIAADAYRLDHSGFRASVALRGPSPGLRKLSVIWGEDTLKWPGPMLAVHSIEIADKPPYPVGFAATRHDHRLRADLLDIQLAETSRCPVRLQVYWSAARARQIDMEVLATTVHEFDKLEVITRSVLPAKDTRSQSECLIRIPAYGGRWVDVREASGRVVIPRDRDAMALALDGRYDFTLTPPFHSPIVCYRPAGRSWSYIEMTHPDDCVRIIARCERSNFSWGFGLFGLDIEKGVILRARVRAVFIPRRRDTDHATRLFKQFVAEPPHLSV